MKSESAPPAKNRAVLLFGPTGSGKTPLGEIIQRRGLWGAEYAHFDFGANLRATVERNRPGAIVGRHDIELLGRMLGTGALLEDEHFPIAERILRRFLAVQNVTPRTRIVLNGLPRHVGQARAIDAMVDVCAVVQLQCSSQTVVERIRSDAGGDRAGRPDDDLASIRRKLAIFQRRTQPLIEHYRVGQARLETIEVTAEMTPEQAWTLLDQRP